MAAPQVNTSALEDWRGVLANNAAALADFEDLTERGRDEDAAETLRAVSLSGFVKLLEKVGAEIRRAALSWEAGISGNYATRGRVGQAVLGAKTLGGGLRRLSDYYPLVQDATALKLDVEDDWASLSYRILDPDIWPRHEDAMYSLGLYSSLIRIAAPDAWGQVEITVEAEQQMIQSDLANIVHANVVYGGASNSVRFPARALSAPLELAPPVDTALLNDLSRDLARKRRETPIVDRARERIYGEISDGCVAQEHIAKELGVSSRTLRRKLASENLSYQSLLDDCRMRFAALEFRTRKVVSLSEIALKLGYSEHSTFSRAFTRWAGVAPRDYRSSLTTH